MPHLFFFISFRFNLGLIWNIKTKTKSERLFGRFATELKITKYIFSSGQKFFES